MDILITGDFHFGYQDRLNDIAWSFDVMLDYCVNNKIKHLIILGDLVHDRTSITHDVSNKIHELLLKANELDIKILMFPGNHDMFNRWNWKINAIKPFEKEMTLIEDISYFELGGKRFFVVPFIESEKLYLKVINKINEIADDGDILLTHIGVNGAVFNACFLYANWNIVSFKGTKFKRIFAGHFHNHQEIEQLVYPGSPIAFRFDEGLVNHGFLVYDIDGDKYKFIDIYDAGKNKENAPSDYVTMTSDMIDENLIKDNAVKIQLKDGDDEIEIRKKLIQFGAKKVIFSKQKETVINLDKPAIVSGDVFSSWLTFDNPTHLKHDLLIKLEKQIRLDTTYKDDDDD